MSEHRAKIEWSRGGAGFLNNEYSRGHVWQFDGGVVVPASASPSVVPVPCSVLAAVDPEEAFVAALSSCHMLWFLSLASKRGYVVDDYRDDAVGVLAMNAAGRQAITVVTLRPFVTFSSATSPHRDEILALHERAHAECFIANSVTTDVRCEPVW
jgi:organic hydroperoxide reductase OsmC/OhrA